VAERLEQTTGFSFRELSGNVVAPKKLLDLGDVGLS
jgi:hypothetical protein